MITRNQLFAQLKAGSRDSFDGLFEKNPDDIFYLFENVDDFIELFNIDITATYKLITYKDGKELEKLFKTGDDFLKIFSMNSNNKNLIELLFINSKHIKNLFNTPDLIIQLAMVDPACCIDIISIPKWNDVKAIFANYQINEPLLKLAGMECVNNLAILIAHYLPYEAINAEHFKQLIDIMKNNPTLEKEKISSLEQCFITARDIHSGNGLFSMIANTYAEVGKFFNQYFPNIESSINKPQQ